MQRENDLERGWLECCGLWWSGIAAYIALCPLELTADARWPYQECVPPLSILVQFDLVSAASSMASLILHSPSRLERRRVKAVIRAAVLRLSICLRLLLHSSPASPPSHACQAFFLARLIQSPVEPVSVCRFCLYTLPRLLHACSTTPSPPTLLLLPYRPSVPGQCRGSMALAPGFCTF